MISNDDFMYRMEFVILIQASPALADIYVVKRVNILKQCVDMLIVYEN
jgi:hypothetical protein